MFKKLIIILIVFVSLGGVYLYSSYDLKNHSSVPTAYGSSLASSLGEETTSTSTDDQINADIAFLSTLTSLKNIKIDKVLFESGLFNKLKDNTVLIDPVPAGRINPFAPIEKTIPSNISTTPRLVTNQASQVTDKTAVLNGTVNVATGIKNIYFEYGPTEALGSKTSTVKQSLVGTFAKSVGALIPETNYFYRAVAEINGASVFGEILSFATTN